MLYVLGVLIAFCPTISLAWKLKKEHPTFPSRVLPTLTIYETKNSTLFTCLSQPPFPLYSYDVLQYIPHRTQGTYMM